MEERKKIGILGEEAVAYEYRRRGYDILAANFSTRYGEIDIIAALDDCVIICEVKTRKDGSLISAKEAVTYSKQQKIITTTKMFLAKFEINDVYIRFDVAEVTHKGEYVFDINIIENAFTA